MRELSLTEVNHVAGASGEALVATLATVAIVSGIIAAANQPYYYSPYYYSYDPFYYDPLFYYDPYPYSSTVVVYDDYYDPYYDVVYVY